MRRQAWRSRSAISMRYCLSAAAIFLATISPSRAGTLVGEDELIPSSDPGIQLFVRNKHPAEATVFTAARTVLFIHGSTYPAETTFDLALGGSSWMDFIAEHGFDVYL